MQGRVASLASSPGHDFSKEPRAGLRLLAGLGVEGDAHCGPTVKHRSRVALDPSQPNLRQVLLLEAERIRSVAAEGYAVGPGTLGENLLTEGLDLHDLPVGTRLEVGADVVLELTGLRNPCAQIEDLGPGLLARFAWRDEAGQLVRRAGVMAIVLASGEVKEGDAIRAVPPPGPPRPLERI